MEKKKKCSSKRAMRERSEYTQRQASGVRVKLRIRVRVRFIRVTGSRAADILICVNLNIHQ